MEGHTARSLTATGISSTREVRFLDAALGLKATIYLCPYGLKGNTARFRSRKCAAVTAYAYLRRRKFKNK